MSPYDPARKRYDRITARIRGVNAVINFIAIWWSLCLVSAILVALLAIGWLGFR